MIELFACYILFIRFININNSHIIHLALIAISPIVEAILVYFYSMISLILISIFSSQLLYHCLIISHQLNHSNYYVDQFHSKMLMVIFIQNHSIIILSYYPFMLILSTLIKITHILSLIEIENYSSLSLSSINNPSFQPKIMHSCLAFNLLFLYLQPILQNNLAI